MTFFFFNKLTKFLTIWQFTLVSQLQLTTPSCPNSEVVYIKASSSLLLGPTSHHFPLGEFIEQPRTNSTCQSVQPSQFCPCQAGMLVDQDGHEANRLANKDIIMNFSKCYGKNKVIWNGMG